MVNVIINNFTESLSLLYKKAICNITVFITFVILHLLLLLYTLPINASDNSYKYLITNDHSISLDDELAFLAEEQKVTIASKQEEKVSKAPSVVTVITANEIKNLGFRTLSSVLRIVPGFDILKDAGSGQIYMDARGVREADRKIKIYIDGHSINMPYDGETSFLLDDYPLKNVKQIEIIRGPGSALYGANAFLAVINIVTKDALDIDGLEVTSGFGSFDSQEYSVLFGKQLYDVDVVAFADFTNTNGLSREIKQDAFTGTPIGLAPGDTDDSRNELDLYLKLSYKDIKLNGKYLNKDMELFTGSNFILTNDGEYKFNHVLADLSYEYDISDRLTFKPKAYYDQYDIDFLINPFPPGFEIPADLDGDGDIETFPDGLIADGTTRNRRVGSEFQFDYSLFDNNTFTLGFNYEWERQDKITMHANFNPLTSAALDSVQGAPDNADWTSKVVRQIWAIYIQDKWDITNDLGLTFGVRHDHYSDFEGTTNPRLAIVWNFMEDFTLKLLYGQAFHAPSLKDLYLINNPTAIGNPNLTPETIRTYEIVLNYEFNHTFSANVNYFFNVIRDEIGVSEFREGQTEDALLIDNLGGSNIQGIEFEFRADLHKYWNGAYAFANYTYQDAEAKGDPLPDVPKHKGNVGVNFELTKYLNANLHSFISGSRPRIESDPREDSSGYALVNLTLSVKNFFKNMKMKASLLNLLDKDYKDPAPAGTIPTDLPRPGRTFFIELGYDF